MGQLGNYDLLKKALIHGFCQLVHVNLENSEENYRGLFK